MRKIIEDWYKPASRARVGQWKPAMKPEAQPRVEGQVFINPTKLCWQVYHYWLNLWEVFSWPALNNVWKISPADLLVLGACVWWSWSIFMHGVHVWCSCSVLNLDALVWCSWTYLRTWHHSFLSAPCTPLVPRPTLKYGVTSAPKPASDGKHRSVQHSINLLAAPGLCTDCRSLCMCSPTLSGCCGHRRWN